MKPPMWTPLLLASALILSVSADFLMGGHLDNKNSPLVEDPSVWSNPAHLVLARTAEDDGLDLIAEESASSVASTPYPDQEPRYKVPFAYAFNGGKPFSLEKDPITGKIDLEKTPPLKALNLTDIYQDEEDESDQPSENDETARIDHTSYGKVTYSDSKRVVSTNVKNERVGPNEINPYSPSFHDFLNLPVKYNSDKYNNRESYPLISSSYANTKVQSGASSYNINNHRPSYHQETATEMSINTQTRRVYYPKTTSTSTTTTTTTTTTPKPTTTSTTTTTTTTTTSRPTTEKRTTTARVTRPATTTTTTTQPPGVKVTTWKPSKSTTQYEEYEDMLPIEKLQGSKYGNYPTPSKEMNGHNNGPQGGGPSRPPTSYEYSDGYEYYDSSHEDGQSDQQHRPQVVQKIELEVPPSTIMTTTTTRSPTTTTTTSTTTPQPTTTTSTTTTTTTTTPSAPTPTVHLKTMSQPPVTSLPLDSPAHVPPVHENFVESHRPVDFNNNNVGHGSVHYPGSVYPRPGSVISVLPESTSNVIVPHDQDTVSFVLGNRQNVEGSYYTHGAAMEEHPFAPNSNKNTFRPIMGSGSSAQPPQQQQTMVDQTLSVAMPSVAVVDTPQQPQQYNPTKWYANQGATFSVSPNGESGDSKPASSFAFPSSTSDATRKDEATLSTGFVTFPDASQDKPQDEQLPNARPVEEHVIVINQADGSIKEITPTGATNLGENSFIFNGPTEANSNLPQLSESLTPPAQSQPSRPPPGEMSPRPPYYFHYQHGNNGPNSGNPPPRPPQRIPLPPRQKPEHPPVGFKRRPTPHDPKLPNILPQFRPNAKTSHGHRGSDKIGTLPAPQPYPNRPRPTGPQASGQPHVHPSRRPQPHPISPPPTHLQRLNPPPPPSPKQQPPHNHHHHQILRKKEDATQQLPPNPEHHKRFRPPVVPNNSPRPVVQKLRMEDEIADRFSAEPPQVPPRPIIFPKNRADSQMPKVATLQMIQQRGGLDEEIIKSNLPPLLKAVNRSDEKVDDEEGNGDENSSTSNDADRRKDSADETNSPTGESGPVYVVYPVNSAVNIGSQEDTVERDESVVIGTRGPHRPLPPDTLPQDDDEEHKDSDDKGYFFGGKRPQFNQVNAEFPQGFPPVGIDSPMLVREKPLLVPSDEADQEPEEEPNVISYLQDFLPYPTKKQPQQQPQPSATISATLPRLPIVPSSSPIAFVYTPTTPAAINRHADFDSHEDEKPVLLPSQQPSSSSSSAPSPQNFMAPFIASVSAEMPAKNGWSVVVTSSNNGTSEQRTSNKDDAKKEPTDESVENETQTERNDNFDPDNFKPVLFGGFKPIYEFPVDEDQERTPMVGRGVVSKSDSETLNVNAESGRKLSK